MKVDQAQPSQGAAVFQQQAIQNIRRTAAILALFLLAYAALISWYTWRDEKADYVNNLTTIAQLEARAINSYFSHLETHLKGLGDELAGKGELLNLDQAYAQVLRFKALHTELFNVTLIQADGKILLTAKNPPGTISASLAEEPSFIAFVDEFKQGKVQGIGQPLVSAVSKVAIVPVRYGVKDRQGNLRYVVSANLPHEHLRSFWMDAPIAAKASLGLMRDNGYLLSRYPVPANLSLTEIYGQPRTGALIKHLQEQGFPAQGYVQGPSSLDGPHHLNAFYRLPDYPVSLFIAMPLSQVWSDWWKRVSGTYFALLFLLVGGVLAYQYALRRQLAWNRELARSEEVLRASEARFRHFFEKNGSVMLLIEPGSGTIVSANQAAANYYGYPLARLVGMGICSINALPPAEVARECERALHEERNYFSFSHQLASGEVRDVEVYSTPIQVGEQALLFSIVHDVTRRKQAEAELERYQQELESRVETRTRALFEAKELAEAADRAKSAFLANMSHEFNTPLNGILGMVHLLRRSEITPQQAARLDTLEASGKRLHDTLSSILDLSRIQSDQFQLDAAWFGLADLMHDIEASVAGRAEAKGLQLSVSLDDLPQSVHGDYGRLRQALLNYAENAIRFSDQGAVTLSCRQIKAPGLEKGRCALLFEVTDSGIGMSLEQQGRVFNAFEQADNSLTRSFGGVGLGLAITKELAERMGGEVGVRSELGQGSTFWLKLSLEATRSFRA